jgi:hypothetical protein
MIHSQANHAQQAVVEAHEEIACGSLIARNRLPD